MGKITLAGARVSKGLTQEEMARKMGVSRTLINLIETGNTEIKPHYLYAYCYITGFSVDDFLLPKKLS